MRALFVYGALLLAAPLALWAAPPDLPASPFSGTPAEPAPPAPTLEDIRRELLGIDADLAEAVRTQDLGAIPRLSAAHDRLAGIEAGLLDLRRAAAANAAAIPGDEVLIEQPDGSVSLSTREDARDAIGARYDAALAAGGKEALTTLLPDRLATEGGLSIESGIGRVGFVNLVMDGILAEQDRLLEEERRRLAGIDTLLGDLRGIAGEILEARDMLIRLRDGGEEALANDGDICLSETAAPTRLFTIATRGYSGLGDVPVHGNVICLGPTSFLVDTGGAMREYRCQWPTPEGRACTFYRSHPYTAAEDDREGPQVYWYADGATHFFYSSPD